jgi:ADP-ribose pyrophosphatase YjhB (NUDIX family)
MSVAFYCSRCGVHLPHAAPVTCPACHSSHWRNPKPCAGALVTHEGNLLLVRRAHEPYLGYWDIPGGFMNYHEHPMETARREIQEETGLIIRITGLLGLWMDDYGVPPTPELLDATLNIYYHAVPLREPVFKLDPHEIAEAAWFLPSQLPANIAFPDHESRVLRAWQETFLRQQTITPLFGGPDEPSI